jgi:membrane protein DedA with SNARE-associated domain
VAQPPPLPGVFHTFAPLLDHYGYLAVAVALFGEDFGLPLPGETVLIAASVYAGTGRLNIVAVGAIAVIAAVAGDNLGYAIGHFGGRRLVLRWGRYVLLSEARLAKAETWFARHGVKVIIVARFIAGLRHVNGLIAGLTRMRWRTFLACNALGAALWVAAWCTVGYVSGRHINAVYHALSRGFLYLAAVVAAFVVYRLIRHLRRRRGDPPVAAPTEKGGVDDHRYRGSDHTAA